MLVVDRKTRPWALASALLLVAAVGLFIPYWLRSPPRGPSGGSIVGLVYGSVSATMLLLALLLGARKRLRTWRVGPAYTWMQLHVWMGTLCYPIAYLHVGAFRWGSVGSLTWVIMLLMTVVWVSGIVGLVLQQFVPKLIFDRISREVTYEQHEHVLRLMRDEAAATLASVHKEPDGLRINVDTLPAGTTTAAAAVALQPSLTAPERLQAFYDRNVAPFMADRPRREAGIRSPGTARTLFRDLRRELPDAMHGAVDDLELLVDERRQMLVQAAMHRALHWWLFAHVPLSYALAVLVALHAVFAVRYVR